MASNISRLSLMKSAATPRLFSTATKGKRASLFQKLSDLETTEGDVAEALDQWVAGVKSSNVLSCVNRLLKDEKYKLAAQVNLHGDMLEIVDHLPIAPNFGKEL